MLLIFFKIMQKACFGAGCFWHVELEFSKIKGVTRTLVGYMGGKLKDPSYEAVCTDRTGHAEVVYLEYDEKVVSYEKLLDVFWKIHDPTTLNKQGPDIGTQYRSAIFYYTNEQKEQALKSKEKINKKAVTEIVPADLFYKAEEYHQQYLKKRGLYTC